MKNFRNKSVPLTVIRALTSTLALSILSFNADAQQPANGQPHSAAPHVGTQQHAGRPSRNALTESGEAAAFVAAARAGAERYRDRNAAIAAGFRRLGRDFPSMGEHWAHPGKVIAGRFDVSDPGMLTYASIDGKPHLLGVVYAIPLGPGEHPPKIPGGVSPWHEHNGTVDEESFLPEHGGDHPETQTGTRLAILHVWTLLPNPAGPFAAENWALPFARLHLEPPAKFPEMAARALSLASGSSEFYANLLEGVLPAGGKAEWRSALTEATARGAAIVAGRRTASTLSPAELDALEQTWRAFVAALAKENAAVARRLEGAKRVKSDHLSRSTVQH